MDDWQTLFLLERIQTLVPRLQDIYLQNLLLNRHKNSKYFTNLFKGSLNTLIDLLFPQ